MKNEKPKCYGCGKKGNEIDYLWVQFKGQEGHLWHKSCVTEIGMQMQKVKSR